jgi:hypothetical protein
MPLTVKTHSSDSTTEWSFQNRTTLNGPDARYGSLADISERIRDVRFTLESGHPPGQRQCPLSANSRHSRLKARLLLVFPALDRGF